MQVRASANAFSHVSFPQMEAERRNQARSGSPQVAPLARSLYSLGVQLKRGSGNSQIVVIANVIRERTGFLREPKTSMLAVMPRI